MQLGRLDVLKSAERPPYLVRRSVATEPIVEDADDEIDDVTLPLLLALEVGQKPRPLQLNRNVLSHR